MSVAVERSTLSVEQRAYIRKGTFVMPTVNHVGAQTYTSRSPIYFFREDTQWTYLPFNFACRMFNCFPHDDQPYPTVQYDSQVELRDYQVGIVGEALDQLHQHRTTTLKIYTGGGKTVIACHLMAQLGLRTLVMTPNLSLGQQWARVIQQYTHASVGILGTTGRESITNLDRHRLPLEHTDVLVAYFQRVGKLTEDDLAQFGVVVFDEAHLLAVETNRLNFFKLHPRYLIACTATLARRDGFHKMIQLVVGTHYVKRTIPHQFHVIKVETNYTPEPRLTTRGVDYTDLVRLISENFPRNMMITDLCQRELTSDCSRRGLILTSRIDHVRALAELVQQRGMNCATLCGDEKGYTEQPLLIGTYKKIGVGFDEANYLPEFSGRKFKFLIIAVPIKYNKQQDDTIANFDDIREGGPLEQIIGRVMRSDCPTIYYLVDNHMVLLRHWQSSVRWFQQFERCQITTDTT